jgi:hypothetical protein
MCARLYLWILPLRTAFRTWTIAYFWGLLDTIWGLRPLRTIEKLWVIVPALPVDFYSVDFDAQNSTICVCN